MKEKTFTQAEAEAKGGKKIQTNVEFSGVLKGSTGKVVRADSDLIIRQTRERTLVFSDLTGGTIIKHRRFSPTPGR